MGRKANPTNSSLGKNLIKKHQKKHLKHKIITSQGEIPRHTTDCDDNKPKLTSILELNSLDEFVHLAQMSNKTFFAQREVTIINHNQVVQGSNESLSAQMEILNIFLTESSVKNPQYKPLKIPRRPKWNEKMSAQEINQQENISFLEWRRDIAQLEENNIKLAITPFEKNIEVWKQLWRVIERADLLLQIVDARNPYFFYSQDLEKYIKEVGQDKEFLLLINKADYLSNELKEHWSKYFNQHNVKHIFFSALQEQDKIDKNDDIEEQNESEEEDGGNQEQQEEKQEKEKSKSKEKIIFTDLINTTHLFTRKELLTLLDEKAKQKNRNYQNRLMVGMVGYPNVGKSSVINVLCGCKRVGVAAMPGKTKHFQTLNLEGKLCLCDCPGLVFPSFANSKAEMMCCGVLAIDTMKDHISPISLVVSRVPKDILEVFYKIKLPPRSARTYNASTFLQLYAAKKGFVTGRGIPNESQAARLVLKDYVNGKLLFCHIRPDYDIVEHGEVQQSGFNLEQLEVNNENDDQQEDNEEDKQTQEESKQQIIETASQNQVSQLYVAESALEEALDQEFFSKTKYKELKLNKGEKRALKFAMQRGDNIEEIPDLKGYLQKMIQQRSDRTTVKEVKTGVKENKYARGGNNSNKFYAFTQMEGDEEQE